MGQSVLENATLSPNAYRFLYACAFWTVAADEELAPSEQAWLIEQFGEESAVRLLEEFVSLDGGEFFSVFDQTAAALTDAEKLLLYPELRSWLESCAVVDGSGGGDESGIIGQIAERVSLDAELARLTVPEAEDRSVPDETDAAHSDVGAGGVAEVRTFQGHEAEVTALAVSPDGGWALSGAEDAGLVLWAIEGEQSVVLSGHELGVMGVCFARDGATAYSCDRLGAVFCWDVTTATAAWSHQQRGQGGMTSIDINPDGSRLVTASDVGVIAIRSATDGSVIRAFGEKRSGASRAVRFSRDGSIVISGSDDRAVHTWGAEDGRERLRLEGHMDGVLDVCVSPDGRQLVSASRDNTLRMWDADSGALLRVLEGHGFTVASARFAPDGRHVLSASWDHTLRGWDVASGELVLKVESEGARFTCLAFAAGGKRVLVGTSLRNVRILEVNLP